MDQNVKIIRIKAGRKLDKRKKKKRYKHGYLKGEICSESDKSIDELLVNSSDWSSFSDEPKELKGKIIPIKTYKPDSNQEGDRISGALHSNIESCRISSTAAVAKNEDPEILETELEGSAAKKK